MQIISYFLERQPWRPYREPFQASGLAAQLFPCQVTAFSMQKINPAEKGIPFIYP